MRRILILATALLALASTGVAEEDNWAIAIHGGAGTMSRDMSAETQENYRRSLMDALGHGMALLEEGATALEVVESVVRRMEDDPLFNAGRGSVFTHEGHHEMDAAIMDGSTLNSGAVTGLRNVRNPISVARLIKDESPHVFLAGPGANEFARLHDAPTEENGWFFIQRRFDQLQKIRGSAPDQAAPPADEPEGKMGTVGCVVKDRFGNLAAATSTGGMTNKRWGRVGDVPVIGAGTYANNSSAAISGTGWGERFIRAMVAHDISARMIHGGESLPVAARAVIHETLEKGDGGIIAVDAAGTIHMEFNSEGMLRAAANSEGFHEISIWPNPSPRSKK